MSWTAILVLAAGAFGLKAAGVLLLGSGTLGERIRPITALLPAALFAGLIAVLTIESGGGIVLDARLAGVAAAVVAAWRKAPFIVVVALAMATTAALRAL